MSITELRKKLITKIQSTKDAYLLEDLYRILNFNDFDETPYLLNDDQNHAINEAREDIAQGNYSTNEEVQKKVSEWLKQ